MDSKELEEVRKKIVAMRDSITGLGAKVSAAAKTTKQATKAVTSATKVTQSVAALLDFDEINKLKEKTVSVSANASKTKDGESAVAVTKDYPFWTRFGFHVQQVEDSAYGAGWTIIERITEGIDKALGDVVQWVRDKIWNPIQAGWKSMGVLSLGLGAKLTTTAASLWSAFQTSWQSGSRVVQIGNLLVNTAAALWQRFSSGWGSRSVGISNTLVNTAATLWEQFKRGWTGKTLGLKITYATNVGSIKTAVYKALGLSGWPSLSFAARGGIVDGATLLGSTVVGEAGAEAIIPLENHTEWLDKVADRLASALGGGQNINVTVTLDGRVVGQSAVRYIRTETKAGRDPLGAYI